MRRGQDSGKRDTQRETERERRQREVMADLFTDSPTLSRLLGSKRRPGLLG